MRVFAAAWLTLTTILVGFAHRPIDGFPTAEEMIAAAGLVHATICGVVRADADDASIAHDRLHAPFCAACVVASAPGLAASEAAAVVPPVRRVLARVGVGDDAAPGIAVDRPRARGPPSAA